MLLFRDSRFLSGLLFLSPAIYSLGTLVVVPLEIARLCGDAYLLRGPL